ncbi:MAG TPA: hypothetical protein VGO56_00475 [Pyrinomonadaceae bacterium]|jgi:hypothetical protein|nr:hypothetical protein [Pyrinomonadaceae bacterium]
MQKTIIAVVALAFISISCSKGSVAGPPRSSTAQASSSSVPPPQSAAGEVSYKVPSGWTVEKPTSDMRLAQYKLPKAEGDAEDALLILYYFGSGQGGTPEANIERWVKQVKQPDGSDSKDKAKTATITVNGLQVSTVDVLGNYSGGMSQDSVPKDSKSIFRLRGAIIETPKGSYFVKLTGPEKTVNRWDQAFDDYIKSFEFK